MANELYHYGILGQKWGIRRYQNPDGSLTEAGRRRQNVVRRVSRNVKTTDAANRIVRSLSNKEKRLLGASLNEDWIEKEQEIETSHNIAKRIIKYHGDIPVSMFEIWNDHGSSDAQIAIATDPRYRGKGYALQAAQQGLDWYNRYGRKQIKNLYWIAEKHNKKSIALAEKLSFSKLDETKAPYKDKGYVYYKL